MATFAIYIYIYIYFYFHPNVHDILCCHYFTCVDGYLRSFLLDITDLFHIDTPALRSNCFALRPGDNGDPSALQQPLPRAFCVGGAQRAAPERPDV